MADGKPPSNKGKPPKGSKKGLRCEVSYCRNLKARKSDGYYLTVCWKCRARWLKENHPATYVMNAMRNRARARRVPWKITLAQFKDWCAATGYLEKRGHGKGLATIDRINADLGYTIDNIQILEFLENCTKGHYVPGYKFYKQNASMPEENKTPLPEPEPDEGDNPF